MVIITITTTLTAAILIIEYFVPGALLSTLHILLVF